MDVALPRYRRWQYRLSRVVWAGILLVFGLLMPGLEQRTAAQPLLPVNVALSAVPCQGMDLAATLTHQGAAGNLVGTLRVMAPPDEQCTLAGQPQIQVRDAQDPLVIESAPPDAGGGMTVTLSAGVGAEVEFQWRKWCGAPPPAPFTTVLILPNGQGEIRAASRGGGAEGTPLGAAPLAAT